MANFEIEFTEEIWKRVVIEAKDIEEASEKFYSRDYDESTEEITGGEIQDGVDIEEVEN